MGKIICTDSYQHCMDIQISVYFSKQFDGGYPFYIICIVFEIISRQKNYKDFSLSMNKHYIPILMYANHFSGKFRIESIYQIMLLISSQGI